MNLQTALDEYPAFRLNMKKRLLDALTAELVHGDIPEQPDTIIPFRSANADEHMRVIVHLDECIEGATELCNVIRNADHGAYKWLLGEDTEINSDNIGLVLERMEDQTYNVADPEADNLQREGWRMLLSSAAMLLTVM